MTDTPELDRLKDRLFSTDGLGVKNFHVSWGPEAYKITPEERAAMLNSALDDIEEQIINGELTND